ncbi:MAG: hypothetical protein VB031_00030 [Eubacteriaceae bacterium]|nr:hypothetical protein [Eubacteriaceae bacterium]
MKRKGIIIVIITCIAICALTIVIVRAHRIEDMTRYPYESKQEALKSTMTDVVKDKEVKNGKLIKEESVGNFSKENNTYYLESISYKISNKTKFYGCVIVVTEKYNKYKGERMSAFYSLDQGNVEKSGESAILQDNIKDNETGTNIYIVYGMAINKNSVSIGNNPARLYDSNIFGYVGDKDIQIATDN